MSRCPPNCRHCEDDLLHEAAEREAEEADALARLEAHDREPDEEDFEALDPDRLREDREERRRLDVGAVNDRTRLIRMLKRCVKEAKQNRAEFERRWAELPRITINDPPRRYRKRAQHPPQAPQQGRLL